MKYIFHSQLCISSNQGLEQLICQDQAVGWWQSQDLSPGLLAGKGTVSASSLPSCPQGGPCLQQRFGRSCSPRVGHVFSKGLAEVVELFACV